MNIEKDDNLDKLFKTGLEDPVNEPAFRDTDWDAMEQMLDKRKKRSAIVYWLPIVSSAAALVIIFLGYLFLRTDVVKPGKKDQVAANHPTNAKPIDKVKSKYPEAKIILAGMQVPPSMGADYVNNFKNLFPKLAEKNKVGLVPFLLAGVDDPTPYASTAPLPARPVSAGA